MVVSEYQINCTLEKGSGLGLAVSIVEAAGNRGTVAVMEQALSFKEATDFRSKFSKFVELGVGGLKKEIDELYRRAFASRGKVEELWGRRVAPHLSYHHTPFAGTSPDTLRQLGIGHVKVREMEWGLGSVLNEPFVYL